VEVNYRKQTKLLKCNGEYLLPHSEGGSVSQENIVVLVGAHPLILASSAKQGITSYTPNPCS